MEEKALFCFNLFLDRIDKVRIEYCNAFAACGYPITKFSNVEDYDETVSPVPFLKLPNSYDPGKYCIVKDMITLKDFGLLVYTHSLFYLVSEVFLMKIIKGDGLSESFEGRMCLAFGISCKNPEFLGFRIFREDAFEKFTKKVENLLLTRECKIENINNGKMTKGARN